MSVGGFAEQYSIASNIYTNETGHSFPQDLSAFFENRPVEARCALLRMANTGSRFRKDDAESARSSEISSNAPPSTAN
jgi:hypothetical protein